MSLRALATCALLTVLLELGLHLVDANQRLHRIEMRLVALDGLPR